MKSELQPLSVRDQVCLALKVPDSDQSELDNLINQARTLDMVQAAAVSMAAKLKTADGSPYMTDTHLHRRLTQEAGIFVYAHLPVE